MVSRLTYTKLGSTEGESTAWIDEHFDSQGFRRKARHRKELVVGLLWVSSLACAVGLTRWYDNSWLRVDSRSIQSVAAVDYNCKYLPPTESFSAVVSNSICRSTSVRPPELQLGRGDTRQEPVGHS